MVGGVKSVDRSLTDLVPGSEKVSATIGKVGSAISALAGLSFAGLGLKQLADMADAFTSLNARLNLATGSVQAATVKFEQLREIANKSQQPLADIAQVYLGIQRAAGDLGASQNQLIQFTNGVAASLKLSGTSGQAASGALLQLSQMMGGTNVQAQEFNSLVDGAPVLLRAVAAHVDKTGVSMGELRRRVLDGKLGTREFFDAFLAGSADLVRQASTMPSTIGGAFTVLQNNAIALTGELDKQYGVTGKVSKAILALAGNLKQAIAVLEIAALAVFGYWKQAVLIPAVVSLWTTAKTALTAALVRFQLASAISGSATATLAAELRAANAATFTLVGGVSKLAASFGALGALFIGWEIGTILRDNFLDAQLFGIAFVNGMLKGWEALKYGAEVAWAYIGAAWRGTIDAMGAGMAAFVNKIADGMAALGLDRMADGLRMVSKVIVDQTRNSVDLKAELAGLASGYDKAKRTIDSITDAMADESIAAFAAGKAHATAGDEVAKATAKRGLSKEAIAAAAKAAAEEAKLLNDLSGISQDYLKDLESLDRMRHRGNLSEERYIELVKQVIEKQPMVKAMREAEAKVIKAQAAEEENLWKWREKEGEAAQKRADAVADQVAKQLAENETLRYTSTELAALRAARLDEEIAIATATVTRDESLGSCTRETEAHKATLQALLDLKAARGEGVSLQLAKDAADEWKKTADSIYDGLTDSLYRAFESGKDFFSAFWNGIKNMFKTTVLKIGIQGVMQASGLGGMLGMGSAVAGTAGGGAGSLGGLGGLASLGASLGTFGTAAGYGLSAAFGGTAMTALSGGASMIGAGSLAGGAGMMLGAAAPYLLAAVAIGSLLKDHNAKLGYGSTTGSRLFGFGRGTDVGSQDQLVGIAQAVLGGTSDTARMLGGRLGAGLQVQAATDIDRKGHGSGIIQFVDAAGVRLGGVQTGGGNVQTSAATKLDDAGTLGSWFASNTSAAIIAGLQASDLPARFRDYFGSVEAFGLTAAKADEMLATAGSVKTLTDQLGPLGGVFGQLGGLSVQAASDLAALTGGIEAFTAKAQDYVKNYYSEGEQAAIAAAQVRAQLKAAGFDGDISTKAQFRALVDSQDLATTGGQQGLAALLNVQAAFSGLADYLATSGQTLAQLADQAPQVALLEQAQSQTEIAQQTVDGITQLGGDVRTIGDRITAAIDELKASTEAGLAAAAAASNATTRMLSSWDYGGAMATMVESP